MKFSKFAKVIKELCDEGILRCSEYERRKGRFLQSYISYCSYTIVDHDYYADFYLTTEDAASEDAEAKSRDTVIRAMPMIFYSRVDQYVKDYIEDDNISEGSLNDAYSYVIERWLDNSDNELGVPVADIKDEAHLRELIMNTNQNLAKIKEYVAAQLLEAQVKAL